MKYLRLAISFLFLWNSSIISAQAPFDCNGQYYLSIGASNFGESTIYEVVINPINGNADFIEIGTQGTGQSLNGIGYRITDNFIYAINPDTHQFFRIGTDGVAEFLTILDLDFSVGYWGAAITPDGNTMIFIASTFGGSEELAFVDLNTLEVVNVIKLTDASTGNSTNIFCTDIAFDPFTGHCYGYDGNANRLLRIDVNTGVVLDNLYPTTTVAEGMGALFFDSFGNMFGYDRRQGDNSSRTLFKIDKTDGSVEVVAQGPTASGKDGCACPYTVQLQKTVFPEVAFPCTEVTYVFNISNASGIPQTGVILEDQMPEGLTITGIETNSFGGEVLEGLGSNRLFLVDMTIPVGISQLSVSVEIGEDLSGLYQNQATLSGLPPSLGGLTLSDNPQTVVLNDSTTLEVIDLFVDLGAETLSLCAGDFLLLDAEELVDAPISYLWSTGSSDSNIEVAEGGEYAVTVSNDCESVSTIVTVLDNGIEVDAGQNQTIELGESVVLNPEVLAVGDFTQIWLDPLETSLTCETCLTPTATPFFDTWYTITATDAQACSHQDSVLIEVIKNYSIYVPNAFSPNFDGVNDEFYPLTPQDQVLTYFQIYDRWGNLVHEARNGQTNDPSIGWDGAFRGKDLNPAVFAYVLEVVFLDGHREVLSGDVSLIR